MLVIDILYTYHLEVHKLVKYHYTNLGTQVDTRLRNLNFGNRKEYHHSASPVPRMLVTRFDT